ncbi:N-6 DNA methylase [Methanoplanus sp. FWC-SCC4]|uniref:site-specific DNA-methyltransferase (adenine-specific) n=1 Tax=Methanochimaera problematica TaxID=2609417 RepID=A0AA97FD21_9EURY|nr:N-6 DNA methylase [Methanoplanus sp. FWC-SCC4]WOF15978.1 N-6 DNA methylase [Methanoplanus sp. FWC-SCC4]
MESFKDSSENLSESSILDSSVQLAERFCNNNYKNKRKPIGQFFTPPDVANYMANQIKLPKQDFSLLDPGAGTGILLAAVCDRIYNEYKKPINLTIVAYENNFEIIPNLEETLSYCRTKLFEKGHIVNYTVIKKDFIDINSRYLLKKPKKDLPYYDIVISNPPYYKLNKDSKESKLMSEFVYGQPNIYSFFVIVSTKMLKENGQFIYITPRSFCSGLYYKKMRKWLLDNSCITKIHSFNSRKNIFEMDNILQEVLIIAGEATNKKKCKSVHISLSSDRTFSDLYDLSVPYSLINPGKNKESYIRIPMNEKDLNLIKKIDSWNNVLKDFNINISTGKVVDFRTKGNLVNNYDQEGSVPLIWMQNLDINKVNLDIQNFEKPRGILHNNETVNITIPVKNYILMKRFTTKNDKRRLFAVPFPKKDFRDFRYIGFENHLNYIYKIEGELSLNEMYGLSALFNSKIMDSYFRTISGSTQVNATDIRKMPLPDYDKIISLGNYSRRNKKLDYSDYIQKILK